MHTIKDPVTVVSSIRLPKYVRDEMKIQAIRAGHSFNSHVVMILKRALDQTDAKS